MNAAFDHPAFERRLLTIDDFYKMGEVGIFDPDERLELIEGELVRMAPIGDPHSFVTNRLRDMLFTAAGKAANVRTGTVVRLPPQSVPEPDVLALKPQAGRHLNDRVGPTDILLLCEVSDTTLQKDQGAKRDLYAKHLIREYWVVDVNGRQVFVYTEPAGGAYGKMSTFKLPDVLSPAELPGVRIAVADLFS